MTQTIEFSNKIIDNIMLMIRETLHRKSVCNVMLTGGRTAAYIYDELAKNSEFISLSARLRFYFGDERCTMPDQPDSNYQLTLQTLFSQDISESIVIYRIYGEAENLDEEIDRYSALLPSDIFDLVLLSVGEDGHIASLFPGSPLLNEIKRKIAIVLDAPKPPSKRITVTPSVIKSAKNIIVMAAGVEKGKVLAQALDMPLATSKLPVSLTIGHTWILNKAATIGFLQNKPKFFYNTRIIYA